MVFCFVLFSALVQKEDRVFKARVCKSEEHWLPGQQLKTVGWEGWGLVGEKPSELVGPLSRGGLWALSRAQCGTGKGDIHCPFDARLFRSWEKSGDKSVGFHSLTQKPGSEATQHEDGRHTALSSLVILCGRRCRLLFVLGVFLQGTVQ